MHRALNAIYGKVRASVDVMIELFKTKIKIPYQQMSLFLPNYEIRKKI